MFGGKDGRSGTVKRARKEQKALARRAERRGGELTGADKARERRLNGMVGKLAYQEMLESD